MAGPRSGDELIPSARRLLLALPVLALSVLAIFAMRVAPGSVQPHAAEMPEGHHDLVNMPGRRHAAASVVRSQLKLRADLESGSESTLTSWRRLFSRTSGDQFHYRLLQAFSLNGRCVPYANARCDFDMSYSLGDVARAITSSRSAAGVDLDDLWLLPRPATGELTTA